MTETWDSKTEKRAAGTMGTAAHEATARGAADATERLKDLSNQGQQVVRGVDQQLEEYTGRSSEAWLNEASRLIKTHPWKAVAAAAMVAYVFGKLRG
jgi:ElaB/YqjD/DUF883 family membrane-anchored ribosome-binding protein